MSDFSLIRQLNIKVSSLKRIGKELQSYKREVSNDQLRLEKLKKSGVGQHDIQQAEQVLEESKAMIPDSKQRLETAIRDLKKFLMDEFDSNNEFDEMKEAKELISESQFLLSN